MTKQALTRLWLGPVFVLVSAFAWFGERQYSAWSAAPVPELTWGCGAANVMPAGVHLPEKAAFNWWLLAAQMVLALLVLLLAILVAFAIRLVVRVSVRPALEAFYADAKQSLTHSLRIFYSSFVLTNFGMRAPPLVVFA